jgi:dihydroorotase
MAADRFDVLLKGGVVVNQDGRGPCDVAILNGRIAGLGTFAADQAEQCLDCRGLTILPGVIDTQVHFREPGAEHKEDLETGSRAAVLGGVTAVLEMPNTKPATTSAEALADKVARAHHRMHCDFGFWVGATASNVAELAALERLPGAAGVKVFVGSSTGDLLVDDEATLAQILAVINQRAAFHCEDEARLRDRLGEQVAGDPASHASWRDENAALLATARIVRLARAANKPVHILHVSSAKEMRFLANQKDIASVEVTPHHLTLAAPDAYARLGTLAQMNPPVRDESHREALWRGVADGVADILGSDHAPHTLAEKAKPYPQSPSGMPGVQTLVPVMLDHVAHGRLSLERFVDMTSAGPARLFGFRGKGRLAVGYDADLTVVDLRKRMTISNDWVASRAGWTPYASKSVQGWPVGTVVRGHRVVWEGALVNPSCGEAIRFARGITTADG